MQHIEVLKSTYLDSVSLMRISKVAGGLPGVDHAVVAMGTDTNLGLMREVGFDLAAVGRVSPDDVVIALAAEDQDALARALDVVSGEMRGGSRCAGEPATPRSLDAAFREYPDINLVVISVPGRFAAREARRALSAGRHVMIFSDNVTLEDEIALKQAGQREGLLVMGPDCGTAVIGGVGLGFANHLPRGPIGIVSASGTGAQEVSSILARAGVGVSHIIGTGGRDVSGPVGAITMRMGLDALADDDGTEIIVIISKAPAPDVADGILTAAAGVGKPCVVSFAGYPGGRQEGRLTFAANLTEAALAALRLMSGASLECLNDHAAQAVVEGLREAVKPPRRFVRGLFSGGTLAQEAVFLLAPCLGRIHTNLHIEGAPVLRDLAVSEGHTILDLGDDAFTRGRAHPMIDQAQRLARLGREAGDPETAVIIMDVVLGYGCNPDPGGEIRDAIMGIKSAAGAGLTMPPVIASICGTRGDPQGYDRQKTALESAGVVVASTNAFACNLVAGMLGGDSNG
jgi:FdrA protein